LSAASPPRCVPPCAGGEIPDGTDPAARAKGLVATGVQLSFCGSAFVLGTEDFPLAEIPLAGMIAMAEAGQYRAKPARVFGFGQIAEAHRGHGGGLRRREDGRRGQLISLMPWTRPSWSPVIRVSPTTAGAE
jgi:hypothetical protein